MHISAHFCPGFRTLTLFGCMILSVLLSQFPQLENEQVGWMIKSLEHSVTMIYGQLSECVRYQYLILCLSTVKLAILSHFFPVQVL